MIYSLFLVVGIMGNLATCVVIVSNRYMRSATNVYITNLALADIITLLLSKYIYIRAIHFRDINFSETS